MALCLGSRRTAWLRTSPRCRERAGLCERGQLGAPAVVRIGAVGSYPRHRAWWTLGTREREPALGMGINSHDGAGCESAGRRGAGGEQDDERARWQKPFGHKGAHRRTARRGRSAWPAAGVLLLFAAFAAGAVTSDVTDTTITTLSVGLIPAGVPFTTEFIAAGDFNFSNAVVVAIANSGGCASTDQWLEMLALTAGSEHRSAPIAVAERAVGTYDICLQANNGAVHTQAVKLVVFTVEDWQGAGGSAALLGAPNVTLRLNCSSWCGGAGTPSTSPWRWLK